ncbi:hypothetical protein OE749_08675 [Aestuariibacter sp. AA17]|uniref:Uncharacterized protein n=1 Tax=Fluctibacter corallii TaxID=2984329 RepID=A0ABT3A868_9ALTE|nr:hypothetical protein [Aestuariibacter sp. AA17]MCV2884769.1 hypothetical protein [Aestuariibacter sp. AA17]
MRFSRLLSLVFLVHFQVNGASLINYLLIDEDIVYFGNSDVKAHTLPECVSSENQPYYGLSLNNPDGRALYSLLMYAMSEKASVSVVPAHDCKVVGKVERAKGIKFDVESGNATQPSKTPQINNILNGMAFSEQPITTIKGDVTDGNGDFFEYVRRFHGGISKRLTIYNKQEKQTLIHLQGQGWLTSLILPRIDYSTHETLDVEITVDGEIYLFSLDGNDPMRAHLSRNVRPVFGVFDLNSQGQNVLASPLDVVSMGRAVPFNNELKITVTSYASTDRMQYDTGILQILPGVPSAVTLE